MAKFTKGQSGNPTGRPKGIVDRRTRYIELLESHIPAVLEKVASAARNGDMTACKLLLDKVLPNMRPQTEPVVLSTESRSNVAYASAITDALLAGSLSPEQAASVMSVVTDSLRIREHEELEKRLEALEKRYGDDQ